jgi:hypothetical protein
MSGINTLAYFCHVSGKEKKFYNFHDQRESYKVKFFHLVDAVVSKLGCSSWGQSHKTFLV